MILLRSLLLELVEQLVLPLAQSRLLNLCHVNLDREILVVLQVALVLVRPVDHVLPDVKHAAPVDEERVEPEVERCLPIVVKLDVHVVVDE